MSQPRGGDRCESGGEAGRLRWVSKKTREEGSGKREKQKGEDMKLIVTPAAPKSAGHYSHAVVHNGVVYVAGQLGIDPANPGKAPGSIEAQTEQTLKNIRAILEAAGSGLDHVLQMTVFVSDIELW